MHANLHMHVLTRRLVVGALKCQVQTEHFLSQCCMHCKVQCVRL